MPKTEAEHFFNIPFACWIILSNIPIVNGEGIRVRVRWRQKWELEATPST